MRRLLALALAALLAAASCTLQTATAPTGDLTLFAEFTDAQDLTAGHTVQVANVVVGSVRGVELNGYRALVKLSIVDGREIPVGTEAVIRRTSLLGEHYVDLVFPEEFDPEAGPFLDDDARIEVTDAQPDFEQLAGQAAEVVGAITADDLSSVVSAASQGLAGQGPDLNVLVRQLADVVGVLASQSGDVGAAVDALGRLGATLAPASEQLGTLVDDLASATASLTQNREGLVDAVSALVELATVTNETVLVPHAQDLGELLAQLDPIVADVVANIGVLESLTLNLERFTGEIDDAIHNGDLLVLAWIIFGPPISDVLNAAATDPGAVILELLERGSS